ncbi:host attachment protein, partial [Acinetobacter baumannii]
MPDVKIPHDALVLIGDGEKALFLRNKGHAARLCLVVEEV